LATEHELSTSELEILRRTHELQQVWDREGWLGGDELKDDVEYIKARGCDPRKERFQAHDNTSEI
jgi:hypothetical protein